MPLAPGPDEQTGPADKRFCAFIARIIKDLSDPSQPPWRAVIVSHELAQPTAALDAVMEELLQPRARYLNSIIRDVLGARASKQAVSRMAFSVIAQCLFYLHNGEVIRRVYPELAQGRMNAREMAAHIAGFSLAALRTARRRLQSRSKTSKPAACMI